MRFRDHLERAAITVAADASPLHLVDPEAICDLGARANAAASYEEIVPDYRRRPDAARGRRPGAELGRGSGSEIGGPAGTEMAWPAGREDRRSPDAEIAQKGVLEGSES